MEGLLTLIKTTPPEKLVKDHNEDSFVQNKVPFAMISDVLPSLDASEHTAGIVLLLATQVKLWEKDKDPVRVIENQDSWSVRVGGLLPLLEKRQLLLVLSQLKLVTTAYTTIMLRRKPLAGLRSMRILIRRLAPGPSYITPQHAQYLELCIAAGNYTAALTLLKQRPFELSPEKTAVDGRDVRLYLYYAGVAWIGNHKWVEAIETLRACVQVPAQGCSAIVIEAYKKFILASLIKRGEAEPLSRDFIPSIQRHAKTYAPYDELVTVYGSGNLEGLHRMITQNREVFTTDHNFGLAKQLFPALQRRIIQSLTKTFLTLSLSDIASRIKIESVQETEKYIVNCIKRGEISASISQKDGMVSFHGTAQANANLTRQKLDERLSDIMAITTTLENADHAMSLDPKYIEKMLSLDKAGLASASRAGAGPMDEDFMVLRG